MTNGNDPGPKPSIVPVSVTKKDTSTMMEWISSKQDYILLGQRISGTPLYNAKIYNNLVLYAGYPIMPDHFVFRADSTIIFSGSLLAGFTGKCSYLLKPDGLWLLNITLNNGKQIDSVHYVMSSDSNFNTLTSPIYKLRGPDNCDAWELSQFVSTYLVSKK